MTDLEAATEEEDEEYKANIEDLEKKSLPSRKCKNMASIQDNSAE